MSRRMIQLGAWLLSTLSSQALLADGHARWLDISLHCDAVSSVEMTLHNRSHTAVTADSVSLMPWSLNMFSLRVGADVYRNDAFSKLIVVGPIADYPASAINIEPDASKTGTLELASIVNDLAVARSQGDVIVRWTFLPNAILLPVKQWDKHLLDKRESGLIFLPKIIGNTALCGAVLYDPLTG